ncbi:hypothetical protein A3759_18480 [Thalassolituus sp. HI0120]|nr:hypothetical protein A3759_18480 [Thalassolituus sp. HI0120]
MNQLLIRPEEVELLSRDGIEFKNNTFIELDVDHQPYLIYEAFEEGTVYWPELKASCLCSGEYLIFTCACGIADDAGWNLITVTHSESEVIWDFYRNGKQRFCFDKANYQSQINECERQMNLIQFPLAVEHAVFPETKNENT